MRSVMRDDRTEKIEDLSRYITPEKCVAFIGSGLSRGVFGDWVDLVNSLCKTCGVVISVDRSTDPKDLLKAADAARNADASAYHRFLGDHFGRSHQTNPLYDVLMRIPFKSYLTLNFDPLLANETRKPEHNCSTVMKYPHLDRAGVAKRTVYYLHGLIREGETPEFGTVVLTASDFDQAYADNSSLLNFLIPTFAYDEILFIGCELREHTWQKVFDICSTRQKELLQRAGGTLPHRVILLPSIDSTVPGIAGPRREEALSQREEQQETNLYDAYDIRVVRYPRLDEYYTGLRRLFEPLARLPRLEVAFGFGDGDA